jgi:hypothetical protein
VASLGLLDWQVAIRDVVLGPNTPYLIHDYSGFGVGDVRTGDIARPQDDGDFMGVDTLPSQEITIPITVIGDSAEDTMTNRNLLQAAWWLRKDEDSVPLNFKLPGLPELQVNGRPRNAPTDLSRLLGRIIKIPLTFYSPDPASYSAVAKVATLAITSSALGGRVYPRVYPVSYGGVSDPNALIATNAGTFLTKPVLRVFGPVTDPEIVNDTQGRSLKFDIAISAGDYLEIDTDARTVLLNGEASRRMTLDNSSQWWWMDPGDNQIRLLALSSSAGAALSVIYSDSYL